MPGLSAAAEQSPTDDATDVGTSPALTWAAPTSSDYAGETHYYVNLYDLQTQRFVLQAKDTGTNLAQAASGLSATDTYQWDVTACNGAQSVAADCSLDTWYNFAAASGASNGSAFLGAASSWYMVSADTSSASDLGCTAARASVPGNRLVILEFGDQAVSSGLYGTLLEEYNTFASEDQIQQLPKACMTGYSNQACGSTAEAVTTLVIGTNNYEIGSLAGDFGQRWANLVMALQSYAAGAEGLVPIVVQGGNDIETWGDLLQTEAWVNAYATQPAAGMLYNFGSCDGCAQAVPSDPANGITGTCPADPTAGTRICQLNPNFQLTQNSNDPWTEAAILDIAGENHLDLMIPEIYWNSTTRPGFGDLALEWIYILLLANAGSAVPGGGPVPPGLLLPLPGILTECTDVGADPSQFTPRQAWAYMYQQLLVPNWSADLAGDRPQYSTDIGYEDNPTVPTACT